MFTRTVHLRRERGSMRKYTNIAFFTILGLVLWTTQAFAWGVLPSVIMGGGSTNGNLLTWDGTKNGNWNTGAVYVGVAENTSAGGNETGYGIFSGSDLVLTQSGNIAGMSGGVRAFDGTNDYLSATTAFADYFLAKDAPVFCIVHKVDTWSTYENDQGIIDFDVDGGGTNRLYVVATGTTGYMRALWSDAATADVALNVFEAFPATGTFYIYLESDGSTLKAGWDTEIRGSWNDIPSTRKATATKILTWAGLSFGVVRDIMGSGSSTQDAAFNWWWTVVSTQTLEQMSQ